jgi:hypothetical protein
LEQVTPDFEVFRVNVAPSEALVEYTYRLDGGRSAPTRGSPLTELTFAAKQRYAEKDDRDNENERQEKADPPGPPGTAAHKSDVKSPSRAERWCGTDSNSRHYLLLHHS